MFVSGLSFSANSFIGLAFAFRYAKPLQQVPLHHILANEVEKPVYYVMFLFKQNLIKSGNRSAPIGKLNSSEKPFHKLLLCLSE
jgi:hypothetical protein